jgi:hypothetical protein
MYYGLSTNNSTNTISLSIGPLYITPEQVCHSHSLFVFISIYIEDYYWNYCGSLFIDSKYFFDSILSTYSFTSTSNISSTSSFVYNQISYWNVRRHWDEFICFFKNSFVFSEKEIKHKKELSFPWWCLFIAYGLCLILVGISILFLIARGIEFGDLKSQQWLTSILSGFFSSIFLTQPLKVYCWIEWFDKFYFSIKDHRFIDLLCFFLSQR